jgi:hypothetical protein
MMPGGKPPKLEYYMGMAAHAAVTRKDGDVFVHLHPSGTVSMAAQQAFSEKKQQAGHSAHAGNAGDLPVNETGVISFPYSFPKPGEYRMWVQVKHEGKVVTKALDMKVE